MVKVFGWVVLVMLVLLAALALSQASCYPVTPAEYPDELDKLAGIYADMAAANDEMNGLLEGEKLGLESWIASLQAEIETMREAAEVYHDLDFTLAIEEAERAQQQFGVAISQADSFIRINELKAKNARAQAARLRSEAASRR